MTYAKTDEVLYHVTLYMTLKMNEDIGTAVSKSKGAWCTQYSGNAGMATCNKGITS